MISSLCQLPHPLEDPVPLGFLAEYSRESPNFLLKRKDFGLCDQLFIRSNGIFLAFAETAPLAKNQTWSSTMTEGNDRNGSSRLGRLQKNKVFIR